MRLIVRALSLALFGIALAQPASAGRPEGLPPGTLLSITQGGCGFAGCNIDETTFFHDGLWSRSSSFLPEPCDGSRDDRSERDVMRDLREAERVVRPFAQADALFIYDCGSCADVQEFTLRTVHGTIFWISGAEDPLSGSGMPADLAAAISTIWSHVQSTTNEPCFGS